MRIPGLDTSGYHNTANTYRGGVQDRLGIDNQALALAAQIIDQKRQADLQRLQIRQQAASRGSGGSVFANTRSGGKLGGSIRDTANQEVAAQDTSRAYGASEPESFESHMSRLNAGQTAERGFFNASPEPTPNTFQRDEALKQLLGPTVSGFSKPTSGGYTNLPDGTRREIAGYDPTNQTVDFIGDNPELLELLLREQGETGRAKSRTESDTLDRASREKIAQMSFDADNSKLNKPVENDFAAATNIATFGSPGGGESFDFNPDAIGVRLKYGGSNEAGRQVIVEAAKDAMLQELVRLSSGGLTYAEFSNLNEIVSARHEDLLVVFEKTEAVEFFNKEISRLRERVLMGKDMR